MKLKWWQDTESGWTEAGVDSAKVFRAQYGSFYVVVYPVSLIEKSKKGWEYKIENEDEDFSYDATFESSVGDDHASSPEEAKKWAENTLKEFLDNPEDMKGYRM